MLYKNQFNLIQLRPQSQDKPSALELLESYINNNPETGYVVFQVIYNSVLEGILPLPNAKITLSKAIGDGYFISKILTTDSSGKTYPMSLPTVQAYRSLSPEEDTLYSAYTATVEAPGYLTTDIFDINIFDNITSLQTIQMIPVEGYNAHQVYQLEPQNLCDMW